MDSDVDPAQAIKQRDAASYDDVAESMALLTARFSASTAERLVDDANLRPGFRVLDVGTGTGIVALEAARRLGSIGSVVGVDLSAGMLETARRHAQASNLEANVEFVQQDAEALTLPERSFDVVLSLYALMHFPHPDLALAEMFRVLRPGGVVVVAIGASPPLLSLRGLIHRLRRLPLFVQARRGRWLAAPAFLDELVAKHLSSSAHESDSDHLAADWVSATSLSTLVKQAGFIRLRSGSMAGLGTCSTADEFWKLQVTFSTVSRKRFQAAPPQQVERLEREFKLRCREVQGRGGRLIYPYGAYWVRAQRPARSGA